MSPARLAALRTNLCGGRVAASAWLSLVMGGAAIAPGVAVAQQQCGPPGGSGQVICPPATYPAGISYNTANPLIVTLQQNGSAAVTTTTGGVQLTTHGLGLTTLNRALAGPAGGPGPTLLNGSGAAVSVLSTGGPVLVDLTDPGPTSLLTLRGSQDAVVATAGGVGGATVLLGAGSAVAAGGSGVAATAPAAVVVDTGMTSITAARDGVSVLQLGPTGSISVTTGGPISGLPNTSGDVGVLIGASNAANADPITVALHGAVTNETGGVRVDSGGPRDVTVSTGTGGSIVAAQDGVNLTTAGTGALTVSTAANILADSNSGTVGNAITLQAAAGPIRVDTAAGTTLSTNLGPFVITAGSASGDISITNRAALSGVNATGIFAGSASGAVSVDSQGVIGSPTLAVRTGIDASTSGAASLSVRSTADIFAAGPAAIIATNGGSGATRVDIASGVVTSVAADGVELSVRNGTGLVSVGGSIVAGPSYGVTGASQGGALTVDVLAGGQVSAGTGVLLQGPATLTVNNAGSISGATGGHAIAVAPAIGSQAVVTNLAGGAIIGAGDAVNDATVVLASGGALQIENAGAITTRVADGSGVFLQVVNNGQAVVDNAAGGAITGRLDAGGGGVSFTNAGAWTTNGLSIFGGAGSAHTLINTGVLHAGSTAPAPGGPSQTSFTGLGSTQNSGVISLVNGYAGDTLSLTGTYAGSGSAKLLLDIGTTTTGTVADTLRIVGPAAGSTTISLTPTSPLGFTSGTLLVQAATGSAANAFILSPDSTDVGLTRNAIVYNAANGGYYLIAAPNAAAAETADFAEVRRLLWRVTADAWSAHLAQLRADQEPEGRGVETGLYSWGSLLGGGRNRDLTQSLPFGGANFSFDQSFSQSYAGAQVGVELIEQLFHGSAVLGLTAGYVDSKADFSFTGDGLDLHSFNIGGYASYSTPLFFVSGLVKADLGSMRFNSGYGGFNRSLDTRQFGIALEGGHRFDRRGWYVEPVVGVSYVRGYLAGGDTVSGPGGDEHQNTLNLFGASLAFPDDNALHARLALRAGTEPVRIAGVTLRPYAELGAEGDLTGGDKVVFAFPGAAFSVPGAHAPTFGVAKIGAEVRLSDRLWLSAQGEGRVGDGAYGGGGLVSLAYHW